MNLPSVTVGSYDEAEYYLNARPIQHDAVLSINDTEQDTPRGFHEFPGFKIALFFHDVTKPKFGDPPTLDDAKKIVAFSRGVLRHRVFIHCAAGISRSTAAAIAIPAVRTTPSRDNARAIMDWIVAVRPIARPNPLIVHMLDDLLGWDRLLYTACIYRFGEKQEPWG